MWSRDGRGIRSGAAELLSQYITFLAEQVQETLTQFFRAVHKADNDQLIALCECINVDIIGEFALLGSIS